MPRRSERRRGITLRAALRLAKSFGTSLAFWMNLPLRWELYFAEQDETKVLEQIYQPVARGVS